MTRRTSVVIGAYRARRVADLVREHADEIRCEEDVYAVCATTGLRRQSAEHGVDLLVEGIDGLVLEQDVVGRPFIREETA